MGSYGDRVLECTWCTRQGQTLLPEFIRAPLVHLWDIDGTGILCHPCDERGEPPHYSYIGRLLPQRISALPVVAREITNYLYELCNDFDTEMTMMSLRANVLSWFPGL